MRLHKIFLTAVVLTLSAVSAWSIGERISTPEDVLLLRKDLKEGKIKVGGMRLMNFRQVYGDAASITDSENKIVYDYGSGLKIEFNRKRYWRSWSYASDKKPAYNKNIDKLRFNLESQKLVGQEITTQKIFKDYEEPTEIVETADDGGQTIYYYGDIKLVFENVIEVKSWKGDKFDELDTGVLKNAASDAPKDKVAK